MEYRYTPILVLDLSPVQMLFNLKLKAKLSISKKLINSELFNNTREKLIKKQNIQKFYYGKIAYHYLTLK